MGERHRLDTEARGIPAVSGTRTLVTAPWTSSEAKAKREAAARKAKLASVGLDGTEWHMAATIVPTAKPKRSRCRTVNPVKVYHRPTIATMAPSNGGNPDA